MKLASDQLKLLGLSTKEIKILDALRIGNSTPLLIQGVTKISRPTIYEILVRLHKRGLVKTNIVNGKKYWSQAKEQDIEQNLYAIKKQLLNIDNNVAEVHGVSDASVIIHRGGIAIKALFKSILTEHRGQRLYMTVTNLVTDGWDRIFGLEGINEFNRTVKKTNMITEVISPEKWFEDETVRLGESWAIDFEGRATVSHEVSDEYFNHAAQIWMFKNSVYLISMNEELIIEIRNSEIQKQIKSLYTFMQDHSQKFDVNARLQKIIERLKK
jgi:hypothetical protein